MGFNGYGGSELDHSDCTISPCTACRNQLARSQPSAGSGSAYSNSTSNPNVLQLCANVFGNKDEDANRTSEAKPHRIALSDEDRLLRDQMRRSGFRIPSFSTDLASLYPVGSHNSSGYLAFQTQNQSAADNVAPETATGRRRPDFSTTTDQLSSLSIGSQFNSENQGSRNTRPERIHDMTATRAPWADVHPTSQDTLRQALHNKLLATSRSSQDGITNLQPSTLPETLTGGGKSDPAAPMARLRRPSGFTLDDSDMSLDEGPEWKSDTERKAAIQRQMELKKRHQG
jgi:hypothetical protein